MYALGVACISIFGVCPPTRLFRSRMSAGPLDQRCMTGEPSQADHKPDMELGVSFKRR